MRFRPRTYHKTSIPCHLGLVYRHLHVQASEALLIIIREVASGKLSAEDMSNVLMESEQWYSLDLLDVNSEHFGVPLPSLTEIAVRTSRDEYPPLAEPVRAVEVKGRLHRQHVLEYIGTFGLEVIFDRVRICR